MRWGGPDVAFALVSMGRGGTVREVPRLQTLVFSLDGSCFFLHGVGKDGSTLYDADL